jgi:PAS domain S-box-containing protein
VEETAGLIARQFSGSLEETIGHLSNLRHRLEMTDFEYFQFWDEDASRIIELHKPFKFIEWIDSSAVIQRIEPKEGNEEAVGLDISTLDYRADDWIQTRRDSVFNITQWLKLVQGDQAFLVDEPVYVNGEFYGTITAGIDFKPVFEQITAELEEYHIIVRDELQNPFFSSGSAEGIESFQHMAATESIYISDANGSYWSVSVVPNSLYSETIWPFDNFIILLLTFILISHFSVLLFFMLKSSSEEKNALRNNRQFRALIESAPIAIYVIDSKGRVVDFWNSAAEQMLGWKREEVMGKFLPDVDEEHMDEYHEIMSENFEKQSISSREVKRVRKDGTQRYFRLHVK